MGNKKGIKGEERRTEGGIKGDEGNERRCRKIIHYRPTQFHPLRCKQAQSSSFKANKHHCVSIHAEVSICFFLVHGTPNQ